MAYQQDSRAGTVRRGGYKGSGRVRLWLRRLRPLIAAGLLGLGCAGCSMSYQLDNLFSKSGGSEKGDPETTGSIPKAEQMPPDADLAYARRAAADVLRGGRKDMSLSWENPATGAYGTVTPLGTDYRSEGLVCRDFLASHVKASKEAWMQGEGCRKSGDRSAAWDIRSLKLWRRS